MGLRQPWLTHSLSQREPIGYGWWPQIAPTRGWDCLPECSLNHALGRRSGGTGKARPLVPVLSAHVTTVEWPSWRQSCLPTNPFAYFLPFPLMNVDNSGVFACTFISHILDNHNRYCYMTKASRNVWWYSLLQQVNKQNKQNKTI